MKRKEEKLYKCIGINSDGALIMVDYLFETDGMCGATGSEFYPVTQEMIDERNDPEYVKDCYEGEYLWKEAVKAGHTDLGLDDYIDSLIQNSDGHFFGHDTSYISHIPEEIRAKHFPDAVTFECVGGGRMFPRALEDLETVLEPELIERIREIEKKDDERAS